VTAGGLLVAGLVVPVPGLEVINPVNGPAWCKLDPGDYRRRRTKWTRAVVLHTTKGIWPQHVIPGAGPGGKDKHVASWWHRDPEHSAAHIVIDTDGSVACLADLATVCAYHATVSNEWTVGIELYQLGNGGIYEATLAAAGVLVPAICEALSIPFQMVGDEYRNRPLRRLVDGGPDVVGVYGHRHNTHRRGRGDPGDAVFTELELRGAERFDFDAGEDLAAWKRRQQHLGVKADGIAGPATMAALRRAGFACGRDVDAAIAA
jgi:hypothetical protein